MRTMKMGIAILISLVIFGCGGSLITQNASAKITLKDGTIKECSGGIWINSWFTEVTRCYTSYGYDDIKYNLITQIIIDIKKS